MFEDKESSGGSYWAEGFYLNCGKFGADEEIVSSREYNWRDVKGVLWELDKSIKDSAIPKETDYNAYWGDFPGLWGRPKGNLWGGDGYLAGEAPPGPSAHDCYRNWFTPGYSYYVGGPSTTQSHERGNDQITPAFPFALHQTAPNPTKTGSVSFAFSVPRTCEAKLTVYDIKGRIVSVPFDEKIIPGEYKAEMSTASLPAGVYIYKLEAADDTAVKKMVITK